jgi:putative acetyltransferase
MIVAFDDTGYDRLVTIWYRAVRATHHFLDDTDLAFYRDIVAGGALRSLELWMACEERGKPQGFIGLDGKKIEALFVDPDVHGHGIGGRLIEHAGKLKGPDLRVDVNEQNAGACAFYRRLGFEQVGRSELDDTGRPYPILHLEKRRP